MIFTKKMTDEIQRQQTESDLIMGLEGHSVPVLTLSRVTKEEGLQLSIGEKVFYGLMRLREAIRGSQPRWYKTLGGVYNL